MNASQNWSEQDIRKLDNTALGNLISGGVMNDARFYACNVLFLRYCDMGKGEEGIYLSEKMHQYAVETNTPIHWASAYFVLGIVKEIQLEFAGALENLQRGLVEARKTSDNELLIQVLMGLATTYASLDMHNDSLIHFQECYDISKKDSDDLRTGIIALWVASALIKEQQYTEALNYIKEGLDSVEETSYAPHILLGWELKGTVLVSLGKEEEAFSCFEKCLTLARKHDLKPQTLHAHKNMGGYFLRKQDLEAARLHLEAAEKLLVDVVDVLVTIDLYELLVEFRKRMGQWEMAVDSLEQLSSYKEKVRNNEALKNAQTLEAQFHLERKEKEFEVRLANTRLQTLTKIASDIAHEVQNPLQFVSNFSEMNVDLVEEQQEYLQREDYEGAGEVAKDLKGNSQKIHEHSKRIAKIVDQLLEQTRKAEAGELEVDE